MGNERRCLKPKDSFKDCPECPEMVVIPAGEFTMGAPSNEVERYGNDEDPQHKVRIGKPFAVGKFEATFADWDACVAAGGCRKLQDNGWGRGKRPVMGVSWLHITTEYLPWLSVKSGKTYRLQSEAEWEYAARAGTTTPFSTGRTITTSQANFNGNTYDGSAQGVSRKKTIEVGSFKPNNFGLYDMHGNVEEWVQDGYKDTYAGAPTDGQAVVDKDCFRVYRGGAWRNDPRYMRSAQRGRSHAADESWDRGFRVARTLE